MKFLYPHVHIHAVFYVHFKYTCTLYVCVWCTLVLWLSEQCYATRGHIAKIVASLENDKF